MNRSGLATDPGTATTNQVAQIMLLQKEIGLTDDERRELIEFMCGLDQDGPQLRRASWRQAQQVVDGLRGYSAVRALKSLRPGVNTGSLEGEALTSVR